VALDLRRLDRVLAYEPGDLTATVQAGIRMDGLHRQVGDQGQIFPLDPPMAGQATLGGVLAANLSGPQRCRYGTARDLVLGVRVAHADGTITKGGSRVVKNATAYDITKLYIGSHGTLAVILEATIRLHPVRRRSKGGGSRGRSSRPARRWRCVSWDPTSHPSGWRFSTRAGPRRAAPVARRSPGGLFRGCGRGGPGAGGDPGPDGRGVGDAGDRDRQSNSALAASARLSVGREQGGESRMPCYLEGKRPAVGLRQGGPCASREMRHFVGGGVTMSVSHGTLRGMSVASGLEALTDGLAAARRALESLGASWS